MNGFLKAVGIAALLIFAVGLISGKAPATGGGTSGVSATPRPPSVAPTPSLAASFAIISLRTSWEYESLYAIGEVKNNGTIAAGVQLEVIARDAQGVLVDISGMMGLVSAGQIRTPRALVY